MIFNYTLANGKAYAGAFVFIILVQALEYDLLALDLTTGRMGVRTIAPDATLSVNGTADNTTGTWSTFSDARIKTVTGEFTDGLNVINQIHPIKFKYNQDAPFQSDDMQIGVVAQELEKVAPYMVTQKEFKNIKDLREVNNQAYVFLLINGMQQQQKMIEELKNTDQQQQADIQTLQRQVEEMKAQNAAVLKQVKSLSARVDAATVPATGQLEVK